jgi:mannose-6-phosphate isomerase
MSRAAPCEPLLFRRLLKEKVWGGRRLAPQLGLKLPFAGPLGETWELSDYPGEETAVRGGAWDGVSLRALMQEHGPALLGRSKTTADGRFPLLVKLIDAGDDLSVQIHPPDGLKSPTGVGKTEAWYVLDTEPGASVICGLKAGTDPALFAAQAGDARVRSHLHDLPVSRGDCIFVPAGQTHAIRGGVVLCEIQQTSDVTYRMYDWDRLGLDGKPREVHLKQALEVVNHALPPGHARRAVFAPSGGLQDYELARCVDFRLNALRADTAGGVRSTDGLARVLAVVGGSGRIETVAGSGFAPLPLTFGDVALIPGSLAAFRLVGSASAPLELLEGIAL